MGAFAIARSPWPVGVVVSVYPGAGQIDPVNPRGAAVTTATVQPDTSVSFTGLADEAPYLAAAVASDGQVRGVTFRTPPAPLDLPAYVAGLDADLIAHRNLATAAHGGIVASSDSRLSDARTPLAHAHPQSDITGLAAALTAKADSSAMTTALAGKVDTTDPRMDVINVKSYGAVGNGTTDDTAAIQAAINAAGSRTVYFPPSSGNYRISAPLVLKAGSKLLGSHRPNWMPFTVTAIRNPAIQALGSFSGAALVQVQDHAITGAAADPNGGSIEGLCFAGANVGEHGINWQGSSFDWTIRDVEVMAVTGSGFLSQGYSTFPQQELNFFHCHAHDCGVGWTFGSKSFDHRLVGCVAHTNAGDGFQVIAGASSIEFVSCRAEWNLGHGWLLYGPSGGAGIGKISMTGCVTDRNANNGVYLESTVANTGPIHLVGHFSNRDGSSGSKAGIRVHNTSQLVVLTGLTQKIGVDDGGGGTLSPQYGVDVTGASHVMLGVQGSTAGVTAGLHWDAAAGAVKSLGYFQQANNAAPVYFPPSTS